MLGSLLIRTFIKDHENTDKAEVYLAYGNLSGMIGLISNILLFLIKFSAGIVSMSTAIIADAFNNLSDAASSVISVFTAKLAARRSDEKHPFGYGRIEYVATMIIAVLITNVGLEFFKTSIRQIREPSPLNMHPAVFVFLLFTVGIKLWLFLFNRGIFQKTGNQTVRATSMDSLFDAVTCSVTLLAAVVYYFFHINIDGYAGLVVSCVVIWSGIGILRDAADSLLGNAVDTEIVEKIRDVALSVKGVAGIHDLLVHSYGQGRHMATLHAEVPLKSSLAEAHAIADEVENEVKRQLGVLLVVHIDPVDTEDKRVRKIRGRLERILGILDPELKFHDLQVSFEEDQDFISFDLDLPYAYDEQKELQTVRQIRELMAEIDPRYACAIVMDRGSIEEKLEAAGK